MHPLKEGGKGSLKRVNSLLSSIFKTLGIEDKIRLNSMQEEWLKLFNEPLSMHTYPVDIKEGELTINVDSPAWLGQLRFFRQDIIKRLEAYNITSVKFKYGRVYQKRRDRVKDRGQDSRQQSKPITDSELAWINETISTVSDDELKAHIKRAIEKAISR